MKQMEEMKKQIDKQKRDFNKQMEQQINKVVNQYEEKEKIILNKYSELEINNIQLQKMNWKLQNRMEKVISKNKIKINNITNNMQNNTNNISNNLIINNPNIRLVDFGKEDLEKISYQIFIDAIKSQGHGLYNKAIEGIHFNKDYPENHPQFTHIL